MERHTDHDIIVNSSDQNPCPDIDLNKHVWSIYHDRRSWHSHGTLDQHPWSQKHNSCCWPCYSISPALLFGHRLFSIRIKIAGRLTRFLWSIHDSATIHIPAALRCASERVARTLVHRVAPCPWSSPHSASNHSATRFRTGRHNGHWRFPARPTEHITYLVILVQWE